MPLAAFPKCFIEAIEARTMTVEQWLVVSDQFSIDGLEFSSSFAALDDLATWDEFAKMAQRHGRSIPMLCHSPDFAHPDWAFRQAEIKAQKQAIDAAAALGAQYCRILSGQRRPEVSRADGVRWVQECFAELIPYAASRRIVLNLENHYKDHRWLYPEFAQHLAVFEELLAGVEPSPWFGVNYDPSNAIIAGEDPIAVLKAVIGRVVTMHASDRFFAHGTMADLLKHERDPVAGYAPLIRHGVVGKGMNDYDQIFSLLHAAGFKGWISIEDGPDPLTGVEDIRESALFLRKKMKEHHLP
jgi:sugar phosphate isomerase/epimerase